MASGDTLLSIPPQDLLPEAGNNPSGGEFGLVPAGLGKGVAFNAGVNAGVVIARRLPANAGLVTGATFKLLVSDDPNKPSTGLVAKFGVNCGLLGDTVTGKPFDTTNLGTEATATVTLPATAGQTKEVSVPIVVANTGGAAANKWVILRVRRLGADPADTAKGRVLLHGVTLLDT